MEIKDMVKLHKEVKKEIYKTILRTTLLSSVWAGMLTYIVMAYLKIDDKINMTIYTTVLLTFIVTLGLGIYRILELSNFKKSIIELIDIYDDPNVSEERKEIVKVNVLVKLYAFFPKFLKSVRRYHD